MSSDRQRLVNSIRRIALTPEERRQLLGDSANRGDQAGAGAKAASQGEQERICCDGSTAPPNAGTEERDPDASSQTGLDPDDPAKLTAGDGTLSGVTDCATGEPVCMDGSGFIPPDGWDDLDSPPELPGWEEGVYWLGGPSTTTSELSPYLTCAEARAAAITCEPLSSLPECPDSFSGSFQCDTGGGPSQFSAATWRPESCVDDYVPGICDYTNEDPPLATQWPSDGCVNLALKSGTIVGSKYDPDQSGAYNTPKSSIRLCDNANGTEILYQPLPGGGFRTIESSGGSAVTDAVGYTYSSDGTLTGTITQAEWDATAP